jgi:hypothetical protein
VSELDINIENALGGKTGFQAGGLLDANAQAKITRRYCLTGFCGFLSSVFLSFLENLTTRSFRCL